jgi:pyruvate/2-oxoglutarate dehydrogenase complex dihydrolipoamide acyltransferase (E2) component
MPYIMPGRNHSAVYFTLRLDVTDTLVFLRRANDGREHGRLTFFHVVLAACVRTLVERPHLNRFVSGGGLYQRKGVQIAFAVKKAYEDRSAMTAVKVAFSKDDWLDSVARKTDEAIVVGRGKPLTASERQMSLMSRLPRRLMGVLLGLEDLLDRWNLLPPRIIEADPLHASLFLANVGSLGVDAPFHHLYERGTASIFAAVGRVESSDGRVESSVGRVERPGRAKERHEVTIRFTFDERVAGGYYCAKSLERFRQLIEDPKELTGRH